MAKENKELTLSKVLQDFKYAYDAKKRYLEAAEEDFAFALGDQWDSESLEELKQRGVRGLTINKIRPNLFLLKGIDRQNRSDFKAFPEGKEDSIEAEISTGLLKNTMKNCMGEYKVSQAFDEGITGGECYIEPYLDYTENLLFGEMKLKKTDYFKIFEDPNHQEYDLSDCRYICKLTTNLTRDQLLELYPDMEDEIESISNGRITVDGIGSPERDQFGVDVKNAQGYKTPSLVQEIESEANFDLLEYLYKKYVVKYYLVDIQTGFFEEVENKQEGINAIKAIEVKKPQAAMQMQVLKRYVPEIWCASACGGFKDFLSHGRHWSFPSWKTYPIIPYFAYKSTTKIKSDKSDLKVQGIVRQQKDLQRELNKRRTQELHLLNTSANSGWVAEEDVWVDEDKVEKFGSSPGVNLYYKMGRPKPDRITPTPLSQGHAQLAVENANDMKESSGINPDLLALQEGGTDSGRAIALRQRQGLVMVQELFDNLSLTKKILGKFILTQLKEIYSIDDAIRVMGESFINENFSAPVLVNGQPQVDGNGQLVMQIDQEAVAITFNKVLNDPNIYKYDIAIGESAQNETVRYANYLVLLDMAKQGIPIPPEVLVDESTLSTSSRQKIIAAIENAQAAAQQANAKPQNKA